MERPVDETMMIEHPPMPVEKRAKIYRPFAALRGLDKLNKDKEEKLLRVPKVDISEDEMEVLNSKIKLLSRNIRVTVEYFKRDKEEHELGNYIYVTGEIVKIDNIHKRMYLHPDDEDFDIMNPVSDTVIYFDDLKKIDILMDVDDRCKNT